MQKRTSFGTLIIGLFILFILQACNDGKTTPPQVDAGTHVAWSRTANIYEVNIRQYTKEGTFKAFAEHLPRLKEMGVDILWLMPIHPIGEKNRKGTLGSYYAVKDYKGVNPNFGTLEDFKALVNEAHKMGMKVIIDWVANHTAWDNPWTKEHPDFYSKDEKGNFIPPKGTDWSDVVDLNYDNKQLWDSMIDALKYWVEECNIDGYRCDVAAMVPLDFWVKARTELDKIKPLFMLAEAHEPELHDAFDMTYGWQLKDVMNRIAKKEQNANHLDSLFMNEHSEYPEDAYRMMFTTNHDENSWNGTAYERLGAGTEAFTVLCGVVEGMPLVYSGQEAGLNKALEFFEKDRIEWKEHPFSGLYKKMFELKKTNKALRNGSAGGKLVRIPTSDDKAIFAFTREKDGNKVVALFNLSDKETKVEFVNNNIAGNYTNLFTNENKSLSGNDSFEMKPWEYLVLYK